MHQKTQEPAAMYRKIDHIAIAVKDLDSALPFFTNILGFRLVRRRHVKGRRTGMVSAELEHNEINLVLCQGTEPTSQVSRLVEAFGPGVAHIALAVDDIDATADSLRSKGLSFDTTIITGNGLRQAFSSRDKNSGLTFELIERTGEEGFLDENVQGLFAQLEKSGNY